MVKQTQKQKVLAHLKKCKSITPLVALSKYGCYRLSAVIHKLRNDGHDIKTDLVGNDQYAKYIYTKPATK